MLRLTAVLAFLILAGTALQATPQYAVGVIDKGNVSHVKFQPGSHQSSTLISNLATQYTVRLNSNPTGSGKISIGAGQIDGGAYREELSNIGNRIGQTIALGNANSYVKPGGEVAFWLEIDGKRYDSRDFTYVLGDGSLTYTHTGSGISFTINAYEPGTAPSGQPLPGAGMTLLIAGGLLAGGVGWRRRRCFL